MIRTCRPAVCARTFRAFCDPHGHHTDGPKSPTARRPPSLSLRYPIRGNGQGSRNSPHWSTDLAAFPACELAQRARSRQAAGSLVKRSGSGPYCQEQAETKRGVPHGYLPEEQCDDRSTPSILIMSVIVPGRTKHGEGARCLHPLGAERVLPPADQACLRPRLPTSIICSRAAERDFRSPSV